MDTLEGSQVVCSVDAEVRSVNVETFANSLEQFRVVHSSFLHEPEQMVLLGHTLLSKVVQLDGQLVPQLPLLVQKLGLISVVEVLRVLGQRVEESVLGPSGHSVSGQCGHLNFDELASSQQVHSPQLVLQVLEVPDSWEPN